MLRLVFARVLVFARLALCAATLAGCAISSSEGDDALPYDDDAVGAYGTMEGQLTSSAILSANGTYGAGCRLRAGGTWSIPFAQGAPLDMLPLQVAKQDAACTLSLVSLRTGSGPSNLYTASGPLALGSSYADSKVFSSSNGSFTANARLSALGFAATFVLTVLVSEDVRTTGTGASTYVSYESRVLADGPLSYWRLDDTTPSALVNDDFAGANGATLQSRAGQLGATWTRHALSTTDLYISSAGRARTASAKRTVYLSSAVQSSADYTVSADLHALSLLADDLGGVVGRASSANETFYFAGLVETYQLLLIQTRRLELWKFVNGIGILLGTYPVAMTQGTTYRVALEMRGTSIRASLDGTERIAVTDSSISAAGLAGITLGANFSSQTDSAGLHLDNLSALPLSRARDSTGTNHGLYDRAVTLGAAGAFLGSNSAATFDGVDDYVDMPREIGNDFTIELWFKSTQGLGAAGVTQWYQTAGLVDANAPFSTNDFGIGLRSDGKILAGSGKTKCVLVVCSDDDQTIVSSGATAYNDGNWHHVVFTRARATGVMVLYVDGTAKGTLSSGSLNLLDAMGRVSIGRLQTANNYFAGSIDEVAVYSSVLSAQSVLAHYQAGRR